MRTGDVAFGGEGGGLRRRTARDRGDGEPLRARDRVGELTGDVGAPEETYAKPGQAAGFQ